MSLFNRPAWAQVSKADTQRETEKDIFNHTERTYATIAEDQRRRRSDPKKNKKARDDIDSYDQPQLDIKETKENTKRRRITAAEGDELLNELGLGSVSTTVDKSVLPKTPSPQAVAPGLPTHAQIGYTSPLKKPQTSPLKQGLSPANVVEIASDSEDEPAVPSATTHRSINPPAAESEDEESDPEIAELKRQARSRKLASASQPRPIEKPRAVPASGENGPSESTSHDPAIHLFITSPIPGTSPLLVWRRLSQRLQEVKDVWCSRQNFTPDFAKGVFLIHRMHRIYNVTTCRGLGLDVDKDGVLTLKGAEGVDGVDKIHLEAVTEEWFAKMKAEREKQERRRLGLDVVDAMSDEIDRKVCGETHGQDARKDIRVLLRTNDKSGLKLKVQPTTVFSKLITACRNSWGVPADRIVRLEFDGEQLDPRAEVQSTELEDDFQKMV